MKTWRQLEAIAKRQDRVLRHNDHVVCLVESCCEVMSVSLWLGNRKTRDRILRAMVEAALEVGR